MYFHIGAPKSGTTYIQNNLWENREYLRERGLLYPGDEPAAHIWAAFDLREGFFDGNRDPVTRDAWPRLVAEIRRWHGPAIISQELFSSTTRSKIEQALDDLSFADVHVIYTARDLARQIPAHWQEDVKNRSRMSFGEFVEGLKAPEAFGVSPWVRNFWRMQDPVRVLARWAEHLPPERVHVVTLPPPGSPAGLLWERFCGLIGIDPESTETQVFANPSLGAAETEFIRRVNGRTIEAFGWWTHDSHVKHHLAQTVLTQRQNASRIRLPERHHRWAAELSVRLVDGLRTAGYAVTGDLDDLLPRAPAAGEHTRDPDQATEEAVLDVAFDALAGLLPRWSAASREAPQVLGFEEQLRRLAEMRGQTARLVAESTPAIKQMIRYMSERHPSVMRARAAYWRMAEARGGASDGSGAPGGQAAAAENGEAK